MAFCLAWTLNLAYALLLVLVGPLILLRNVRRGKRQSPWWLRLQGPGPRRGADVVQRVWLHGVSVGEIVALKPLLDELRRRVSEIDIVLSTTTVAGYDMARQRYPELAVFYSPLDFSWSVRRSLAQVQPDLLVLCELEIWPNWIVAARQQGVPVAVVNGRLGARSFRGYRRWRALLRNVFARLGPVACQTAQDAERFVALGVPAAAVHVAGSLKFDGAETARENPRTQTLRRLAGLGSRDVVFLAGSTSAPEEQLALAAFTQLAPQYPALRLILVPRHPERFPAVAELLATSEWAWCRRSQWPEQPPGAWRILLVDVMGELAAWWGTAQIGYVGGSMGPREGQSMIEPCAYGVATSFGPRTKNFRDVVLQLMAHDAAQVVQDQAELTEFLRRCLADEPWRQQLSGRAQQVVLRNLGATAATADLLLEVLAQRRDARRLPPGVRAPYSSKLARQSRTGSPN